MIKCLLIGKALNSNLYAKNHTYFQNKSTSFLMQMYMSFHIFIYFERLVLNYQI